MIIKRLKESITFPGMLKVLACMLIVADSHAAISREYSTVLLPGDINVGWYQDRQNQYKYERALIIGHDHRYQQYSSLKLFWPEERSPYVKKGMITSFKCIDQTPITVNALIHVIRGGMGASDLVADVLYTPVQFMLRNTMIIPCYIYTDRGDTFSNLLDIGKTSTQVMPVADETKKPISAFYTTTGISTPSSFETTDSNQATSTLASKSTTQMTISSEAKSKVSRQPGKQDMRTTKVDATTQGTTKLTDGGRKLLKDRMSTRKEMTKFYNEDTSKKIYTNTAYFEETTLKIDKTLLLDEEMGLRGNETTLYTDRPNLKTSSDNFENEKTTWINPTTEETSSGTGKTPLEATSPRTVEGTAQKTSTSPRIDNEGKSSRTEETTKIPDQKTSLATNKTSLDTTEISSKISGKGFKDLRQSTISLMRKKPTLATEKTTVEITSPKTVRTSSQKSLTSLITDETTAYTDGQGSTKTDATYILCGGRILEINKPANNANSEDSEGKNLDNFGSSTDKTSITTQNTILAVTSPKTVAESSQKSTSLRVNKITSQVEDKNLETQEEKVVIEKPTTSPWFDLVVRAMSVGSTRKVGLAKITYR